MARIDIDNTGMKIIVGIIVCLFLWSYVTGMYSYEVSDIGEIDEPDEPDTVLPVDEPQDPDPPEPDGTESIDNDSEAASINWDWKWWDDPLESLGRFFDFVYDFMYTIYQGLMWVWSSLQWIFGLGRSLMLGMAQMTGMTETVYIIGPIIFGLVIMVVTVIVRSLDISI